MKGFCLEVTGPYACFTRPEMKVERVSYDVITPSAARAIFEAVLWKPAIRWRMKRIEVLAPIRWASVRRNEVGKVASPRAGDIFIEDDRQQRAGLLLRDVKYRLHGVFEMVSLSERPSAMRPSPGYAEEGMDRHNSEESEDKYAAMFDRRARKGQCFNQPYLGCREFACDVRLVDPERDIATVPEELKGERELGWMLYDLDFTDPNNIRPFWFKPVMKAGVIVVPDPGNREEVRG